MTKAEAARQARVKDTQLRAINNVLLPHGLLIARIEERSSDLYLVVPVDDQEES